jgi:hypothetical protein
LEIVGARDFGAAANLRISGFFTQPGLLQKSLQRSAFPRWRFQPLLGNVMKRAAASLFVRFVWAAFNSRYRNAFASSALNRGDSAASCLIVGCALQRIVYSIFAGRSKG